MKTPKEELTRRREEFKKIYSKYLEFVIKINDLRKKEISDGKSTCKEIDRIYASQEYRELEDFLSSGPIYDIPEEDLRDPEYINVFGCHPLDNPDISDLWAYGVYGKSIETPEGPGIIECLAYNYGGLFYKVRLSENKTIYIPYEPD